MIAVSERMTARPSLTDLYDPSYVNTAERGARAHQILLDWQNTQSKFTRIQRPFLLQNSIAKLTVAKTVWTTREERRKQLVVEEDLLTDENDEPIIDPISGMPKTHSSMRTVTKAVTVYEQARRGEILLGGCFVDPSLPTHFCLACRHRFGRLREFGLDQREALLLREIDALAEFDEPE